MLKKMTGGNPNVVSLHDYFEVSTGILIVETCRNVCFAWPVSDRPQYLPRLRSLHGRRAIRPHPCKACPLRTVRAVFHAYKPKLVHGKLTHLDSNPLLLGTGCNRDAVSIIRTILSAVKYIHSIGIVHRDLKPENLLFRTEAEDANLVIADFGMSTVLDDKRHVLLTEFCGTPGVSLLSGAQDFLLSCLRWKESEQEE